VDPGEVLVRKKHRAVGHLKIDVLIEQRQNLDSSHDHAFAHAEGSAGLTIGGYAKIGGNVARAEVFGERALDDFGRGHQS
jgi:hypothetical protein